MDVERIAVWGVKASGIGREFGSERVACPQLSRSIAKGIGQLHTMVSYAGDLGGWRPWVGDFGTEGLRRGEPVRMGSDARIER